MVKNIIYIVALIIIGGSPLIGQEFKIKGMIGSTRYTGDLAPYSFLTANANSHFSYALSIGYRPLDFLSTELRFFSGKISGNDINSNKSYTRNRNLRFESPINELGLIAEIDLNELVLGGWTKYGIHFFISTGLNRFSFNPRTDYNGQIYFLRDIGTEGQGLPGYGKKYKLNQMNIPIAFGIEFRLTESLNLGIEISRRVTFTDYLDDVSLLYPDLNVLAEKSGDIAAILSYRTPEITGKIDDPMSQLRGDSNKRDWYLFTGVFFSYYFGENPIQIKKAIGLKGFSN